MMKRLFSLFLSSTLLLVLSTTASADFFSLKQTVDDALATHPRLQMLQHNRDAVRYDLEQSRGEYLPSVDVGLGYGTDQYSDLSSRSTGADPGAEDWDLRGEASLSLVQKIYDGGGVKNRVAVRQALLDSAEYRVFDNAQSVALDAVIAHLNVFRQRELVDLSEKNVKLYGEILQSLKSLQEAGAGSIADVTQVQGRLARSLSSQAKARAELAAAEANYLRVVGKSAEEISFAGIPERTPLSLEQALTETEAGNPKVLALTAEIDEAAAREDLAHAAMKPSLNLELNSTYSDQADADPSWKFSNEAMLRLRWNLFNGGQDKAAIRAAFARKLQSRSEQQDQLTTVLEETRASWADYQASAQQIVAYRDAVTYSEKTLDSYLKQFNVAQRSLLDVLDAANEYFQSGGQLATAAVNETVAAYRMLALSGRLVVSERSGSLDELPEYLSMLRSEVSVNNAVVQPLVSPLPVLPMKVDEPVKSELSLASARALVDAWALAWQSQDVARYLGFYSARFAPEGGRSLTGWKKFREKYLSAPESIILIVGTIDLIPLDNGNYRVAFDQSYASNLYQDRVRKILELEDSSGQWQIVREIANPY
jgi:adhesin transport system outer membrane protein